MFGGWTRREILARLDGDFQPRPIGLPDDCHELLAVERRTVRHDDGAGKDADGRLPVRVPPEQRAD